MKEFKVRKPECISIRKPNNSKISYKIKKEYYIIKSDYIEAKAQMNSIMQD